MRILLINPPFNYYNKYIQILEPLSLAYLAAYLRKEGYVVNVLDAVAGKITKLNNNRWRYGLTDLLIIEKIKKFKPDVCGITCSLSVKKDSAFDIAELIKRIDKNIITIVGGIHPTILPLEMVQNPHIDYVIIGEGEESLLNLVNNIDCGVKYPVNVDGIVYRMDGSHYINPKKNFIHDLDSLPFPARDLLPMDFYLEKNKNNILYGLGSGRALSIFTSRGCSKRCSFCNVHLSHGQKWRARSAENVCEEIKKLVKEYNVNEIFFLDDDLTFNKERIGKICETILKYGLKFKWNTPNGLSINSLDEEILTLMKRSGCKNICIAIETGNETIRNEIIGKGLPTERIFNVVNICKRIGLQTVGFFILGMPGETEDTFKDTIGLVKKLSLDMIVTSFAYPCPETKLYNECVVKGYVGKNYIKQHTGRYNMPVIETEDFNKATLKRWCRRLYLEFVKSHFWYLAFRAVTFKSDFFKWQLIRRFLKEKFNI